MAIFEDHFFVESVCLRLCMVNAFVVVNEVNWNVVGPEAVDLLHLVVVFIQECLALLRLQVG